MSSLRKLDQEETLLMKMPSDRKVVQISTMVHAEKDWAFIALCDDGSLWLYHGSWSRIENIPQTTSTQSTAHSALASTLHLVSARSD
jgi:hypothetical protein